MTVPMRDQLNDADLAWAAADPSLAGVMGQLLEARLTLGAEQTTDARRPYDRTVIEPSLLRARGAL